MAQRFDGDLVCLHRLDSLYRSFSPEDRRDIRDRVIDACPHDLQMIGPCIFIAGCVGEPEHPVPRSVSDHIQNVLETFLNWRTEEELLLLLSSVCWNKVRANFIGMSVKVASPGSYPECFWRTAFNTEVNPRVSRSSSVNLSNKRVHPRNFTVPSVP